MIQTLKTSLVEVLEETVLVIDCIDREPPGKQVELLSDARAGAHIRHLLDHLEPLLNATPESTVDYGNRNRTEDAALTTGDLLRRVRVVQEGLERIERDFLLWLRADVGFNGPAVVSVTTSLGRELQFAMSHAVHHLAMVRLLLEQKGATVPDPVGIAPETRRVTGYFS